MGNDTFNPYPLAINAYKDICTCRKQVCECPINWKVGDVVKWDKSGCEIEIEHFDGVDFSGRVVKAGENFCGKNMEVGSYWDGSIDSGYSLVSAGNPNLAFGSEHISGQSQFMGYPAKTVVTEGCGSVPGYPIGTAQINMDDPANWKVGDIVTAIQTQHEVYAFITAGNEYEILRNTPSGIEFKNDGGKLDFGRHEKFKFCRHAEANSKKPIDNPPLQKPLCGCCSHFHGYDVHHDDPCVFTHLERYEPPIRKADFRARMMARNQEIKARIRREDNLMKLAQSENAISDFMRTGAAHLNSRDFERYPIRLREECED